MSLHLYTFTAIGVMLAMFMPAVPIAFAEGSMTLLLVPHCTEPMGCPEYAVSDAQHFTTGQLAAGDVLDLDVLVRGSDHASVRSVKSWIVYDAKILEARSVKIFPTLPSPYPDEQTIDKLQGLVKIGGSTTNGFSSDSVRIARVTFRILETASDTELSFADFNTKGNGHTAVNGERQQSANDEGGLPPAPCISAILGCRGTDTPLLSGEPATLTVKLFGGTPIVPIMPSSSSAGTASSASSFTGAGSTFGILQVQDVRITTQDNVIFLGWQALRSSELAGYNVYYGTVSGRYIQRRSLPATASSLVLRELEPGATYYLAVRAVNKQDQESIFSQEVSVTVGKPETATSPMTKLPPDSGVIAGNPLNKRGGTTINGETGSASVFLWIIVGSALIGTAFALRRQLVLSPHVSR